jgi:hypothetical protein
LTGIVCRHDESKERHTGRSYATPMQRARGEPRCQPCVRSKQVHHPPCTPAPMARPSSIPPNAWAGGLVAAVIVGAAAGLLPAIRAARLSIRRHYGACERAARHRPAQPTTNRLEIIRQCGGACSPAWPGAIRPTVPGSSRDHHDYLLLTRGTPGSGDRASTSRYPLVSALSPAVGAPLGVQLGASSSWGIEPAQSPYGGRSAHDGRPSTKLPCTVAVMSIQMSSPPFPIPARPGAGYPL